MFVVTFVLILVTGSVFAIYKYARPSADITGFPCVTALPTKPDDSVYSNLFTYVYANDREPPFFPAGKIIQNASNTVRRPEEKDAVQIGSFSINPDRGIPGATVDETGKFYTDITFRVQGFAGPPTWHNTDTRFPGYFVQLGLSDVSISGFGVGEKDKDYKIVSVSPNLPPTSENGPKGATDINQGSVTWRGPLEYYKENGIRKSYNNNVSEGTDDGKLNGDVEYSVTVRYYTPTIGTDGSSYIWQNARFVANIFPGSQPTGTSGSQAFSVALLKPELEVNPNPIFAQKTQDIHGNDVVTFTTKANLAGEVSAIIDPNSSEKSGDIDGPTTRLVQKGEVVTWKVKPRKNGTITFKALTKNFCGVAEGTATQVVQLDSRIRLEVDGGLSTLDDGPTANIKVRVSVEDKPLRNEKVRFQLLDPTTKEFVTEGHVFQTNKISELTTDDNGELTTTFRVGREFAKIHPNLGSMVLRARLMDPEDHEKEVDHADQLVPIVDPQLDVQVDGSLSILPASGTAQVTVTATVNGQPLVGKPIMIETRQVVTEQKVADYFDYSSAPPKLFIAFTNAQGIVSTPIAGGLLYLYRADLPSVLLVAKLVDEAQKEIVHGKKEVRIVRPTVILQVDGALATIDDWPGTASISARVLLEDKPVAGQTLTLQFQHPVRKQGFIEVREAQGDSILTIITGADGYAYTQIVAGKSFGQNNPDLSSVIVVATLIDKTSGTELGRASQEVRVVRPQLTLAVDGNLSTQDSIETPTAKTTTTLTLDSKPFSNQKIRFEFLDPSTRESYGEAFYVNQALVEQRTDTNGQIVNFPLRAGSEFAAAHPNLSSLIVVAKYLNSFGKEEVRAEQLVPIIDPNAPTKPTLVLDIEGGISAQNIGSTARATVTVKVGDVPQPGKIIKFAGLDIVNRSEAPFLVDGTSWQSAVFETDKDGKLQVSARVGVEFAKLYDNRASLIVRARLLEVAENREIEIAFAEQTVEIANRILQPQPTIEPNNPTALIIAPTQPIVSLVPTPSESPVGIPTELPVLVAGDTLRAAIQGFAAPSTVTIKVADQVVATIPIESPNTDLDASLPNDIPSGEQTIEISGERGENIEIPIFVTAPSPQSTTPTPVAIVITSTLLGAIVLRMLSIYRAQKLVR